MTKFNDRAWRRELIKEIDLNEGVYDQGIFKAVFLAGGPGSGRRTGFYQSSTKKSG